jgi:uncharacterized protein (DUF302 family)
MAPEVLMSEMNVDGLSVLRSRYTVSQLMDRLRESMKAHGIKVFAHLDFSADASAEGLALRPTQMLIAGNPKAGTPLIEAKPSVAIDLPLKVLAWTEAGQTFVAYNDPEYLRRRHAFPESLGKNISGLGTLVARAAGEEGG